MVFCFFCPLWFCLFDVLVVITSSQLSVPQVFMRPREQVRRCCSELCFFNYSIQFIDSHFRCDHAKLRCDGWNRRRRPTKQRRASRTPTATTSRCSTSTTRTEFDTYYSICCSLFIAPCCRKYSFLMQQNFFFSLFGSVCLFVCLSSLHSRISVTNRTTPIQAGATRTSSSRARSNRLRLGF